MSRLKPSARVVQEALATKGLALEVVELPSSTRTAQDAAATLGCQVCQIAKSIVFRGTETGRPVLVIASGSNRIDEERISVLVSEKVAKASADFVREATGFAIGGVPPIGHRREIVTILDEDLLGFEEVWAAAGTPNAVFRLTGKDLPGIVPHGKVARVAQA